MESRNAKRILEAKQTLNEFSKQQRIKWKQKKESAENRRLRELQKQEIETITKELAKLRDEYSAITSERGLAHRAAILMEAQQNEVRNYEERRDIGVRLRAKQALSKQHKENVVKQKMISDNKLKDIEKRKQLMKSSICKQFADKEDQVIIRKLQQLERAESCLRDMIDNKIKEKSHSELSIERIAERLFWPQPLIAKQDMLQSSVNSRYNQSLIDKQTVPKSVDNQFDVKDANVVNEPRIEGNENAVNKSIIDIPLPLASQLYERLKANRIASQQLKHNKVYRNMATNTTPKPEIKIRKADRIPDNFPENSIFSSETSYLSLPNTITPNRIKMNDFRDNLLSNTISPIINPPLFQSTLETIDIDSLSDNVSTISGPSVDPLLNRINQLIGIISMKLNTD